jgi:hypothetical protein
MKREAVGVPGEGVGEALMAASRFSLVSVAL